MFKRNRALEKRIIGELNKKIRELQDERRELRHEIMQVEKQFSALRATRITYSVPGNLGWMPVYVSDIEMCMLACKFTGQDGIDMPAGKLEITSKYVVPTLDYTEPDDGVYISGRLYPNED